MLSELRIENFAIIETLELTFDSGLITFTGETGAGKSIIIDAVETVLGGRAEATMIRSGAERAYIEATFHLSETNQAALREILEREDLLDTPDMLSLAREIRRNGRSIARVNGRSANTSLLNELGEFLVDVHGQSEHLSLLRVREHVRLLDSFASLENQLTSYSDTYRRLQTVRHELADLRQSESDAARRADLLTYQINEIEAAHLVPGEEEGLHEERNRLANAEGLAAITQEALQSLDEGTPESPSITDLAGQLVHALNSLLRLDPSQTALEEQAQQAFDIVSDLSRSLRLYQENIEFNPKRLDQVEDRLNLIHNLKRKYGNDIPTVLAYAEKARQQLDTITHAGERIADLEVEETRLLDQLGVQGQELSRMRSSAAEKLEKAIEAELNDLNMSGAGFKVNFERQPDPNGVPIEGGQRVAFYANGLEKIEFFVAPNPGEGLKPLVKIASGGETSRLMLALKNVLARADHIPTLIFDEIDQGIGGRVGTIVGQKLAALGAQHQVLCVTHLPQLAAFGNQHFRVQKKVQDRRTHTIVDVVDGESRRRELAQMMGGVTEGTLRSAQELLQGATEKSAKLKKTD
jgi:DNA repair protein RecN (Recombination protein N)